jgi:hypothetical protein
VYSLAVDTRSVEEGREGLCVRVRVYVYACVCVRLCAWVSE